MKKIQMVDLRGQYEKIKTEIDEAIQACIDTSYFIGGPAVTGFAENLEKYLDVNHVIPCANGTDALQIALMALGLKRGDEVIVPAFTYVATAEVIALLGLSPVMVDVDPNDFNVTKEIVRQAVSSKTKAIVPVHLFGQSAPMEGIMELANEYDLFVIEDNAQSLGSDVQFSDGKKQKAGTIGHVGTTSFYPAKNLGAYGDGGAIFTNDSELAAKIKKIANHGQVKRYYHDMIGVNSRLDAIQAAILDIKLKYYQDYIHARQQVAAFYDKALEGVDGVEIPYRNDFSNHVFHQYTLKIKNGQREALQHHLAEMGVSTMVYYPVPLNEQEAFRGYGRIVGNLENTKMLCGEVMSLPIHTEMTEEIMEYIVGGVVSANLFA